MKRLLLTIGLLLVLGTIVFFWLVPGVVEKGLNRMVIVEHSPPGVAATQLHESLLVADMHGDTLLWQRSILDASDRGHMDLPRLEAGNVALQVLSSVTKSPKGQNYDSNSSDTDTLTALTIVQRQPVRTWGSLLQRSLWHSEKLHTAAAASDRLRIVKSQQDLDALLADRAAGKKVTGGMLSIEGLHNLEGEAANLQVVFDAGFRMAGLTHFFDNELAGSMHGLDKGGLTDFGRDIVLQMEALGMIVDVAHLSPAGIDDVISMATRPVVVSHGGVKALCNKNRNLTDAQIEGIAATGGVIGIGYWPGAVCSTDPAQVAAAMRYVRDLVGIEYVGLGSDFDGAVEVSFDTAQLVLMTQALIDAGFSEPEVRLAMGGNVLRVIGQVLPRN